MQEMGWTHDELMDTPYETYLNITRIMSLESKHKNDKTNEADPQQLKNNV